MSSFLMLFTFQSDDSSRKESEESRRLSSSRSDENVENFMSNAGVKLTIFNGVRVEWGENFLIKPLETFTAPKA